MCISKLAAQTQRLIFPKVRKSVKFTFEKYVVNGIPATNPTQYTNLGKYMVKSPNSLLFGVSISRIFASFVLPIMCSSVQCCAILCCSTLPSCFCASERFDRLIRGPTGEQAGQYNCHIGPYVILSYYSNIFLFKRGGF